MVKISSIVAFLISLLMITSCSDNSTVRPIANGQIQFGYTNKTPVQSRSTIDKTPTAIIITIEQSGTVIHESLEMPVQDFNGTIITKPLPLLVGTYEITEFKVKNSNNEVIYATPQEFNSIGEKTTAGVLVDDPLSITFTVSDDNTETVSPEVLDTEGFNPEEFGYPPLSFIIVPTLDFLVAVKTYDESTNGYIMTDAHIEVKSDSRVDFDEDVTAETKAIRVRDVATATYTVTVSKVGYGTLVKTFTNTEIKEFASLPLSIVVNKDLSEVTLQLGDKYQGGIIFYLDETGKHGLIAAPHDHHNDYVQWGCYPNTTHGADGTAIGTGAQNTLDIVAHCGANTAAWICHHLVLDGYSDWFLPSIDELKEMYNQRALIGGFNSHRYWSSTERDPYSAWVVVFDNSSQGGVGKNGGSAVRAIRAF